MSDNRQKENAKLEREAIEFFIKYLRATNNYIPTSICDNRNNNRICADLKAIDKSGKEVYFEIKSTATDGKCWGRITFNEIMSALDAVEYKYFFVVIHKTKGAKTYKFNIVYPYDAEDKPFMTLGEILRFTKSGQNQVAIDFNIHFQRGRQSKRKEIFSRVKDNHFSGKNDVEYWVVNEVNVQHVQIDTLKKKRKSIESFKNL